MEILDDELEHYGRLGMKWGQHIFGKERESTGVKKTRKQKKDSKARSKRAKKAIQEKKKREAREKKAAETAAKKNARAAKRRQEILKDPKKLYRHRYEFSREEVDAALKNFEWENKVASYSTQRLDNAAKTVENFLKISRGVVGGYNVVAGVVNAFTEGEDPLPKINIGGDDKKKKK